MLQVDGSRSMIPFVPSTVDLPIFCYGGNPCAPDVRMKELKNTCAAISASEIPLIPKIMFKTKPLVDIVLGFFNLKSQINPYS